LHIFQYSTVYKIRGPYNKYQQCCTLIGASVLFPPQVCTCIMLVLLVMELRIASNSTY